jgi:uncharacterized OB-fold protein
MMISNCPKCGNKFRPYGSDIYSGDLQGAYYRMCEQCKVIYGFNKTSNETAFEGDIETFTVFKNIRSKHGIM